MGTIDFNSVKELAKYVESTRGTTYLMDKANIRRALQSEMERLQRYLTEEINEHLNSYKPIQYERTGAWLESIRVNPIVQVGNTYTISLTFDDEQAYHPSAIGGEDGYVPWLFEVGYKDKSYDTPHFKGFKGLGYIKEAVRRWNNDNRFGFSLIVYHGDERYI